MLRQALPAYAASFREVESAMRGKVVEIANERQAGDPVVPFSIQTSPPGPYRR